jgi:hypothetical protein
MKYKKKSLRKYLSFRTVGLMSKREHNCYMGFEGLRFRKRLTAIHVTDVSL